MDVNEVGSSFRCSIFVVRKVFDWAVLTFAQGGMAEFKFLNANMLSVFYKASWDEAALFDTFGRLFAVIAFALTVD